MQKENVIQSLESINEKFIETLKKGLEEATANGHEWPHRWYCDGGRLTPLEFIKWDGFYSQCLNEQPDVTYQENSNGDIIVSLTFPSPIGEAIEHIPVPGSTFEVCFFGPHPYRGEGEWAVSGHWAHRKVLTNIATIIFRNMDNNYVLGTTFPGQFKDPGDYSGFDPDKIHHVSAEEVLRLKINFRVFEDTTVKGA